MYVAQPSHEDFGYAAQAACSVRDQPWGTTRSIIEVLTGADLLEGATLKEETQRTTPRR
jgi:hypothetical protein